MSTRCVILIGPMGAGKSDVGENLAENIGYEFIDIDRSIEKQANQRISAIFEQQGEEAFRTLEKNVVAGLVGTRSHVIAAGGGAVLDADNRKILSTLGQVIYLKASARELFARVKNDRHRPLLQVDDPKAKVAALLEERGPIYEEMADIVVDTEDLSATEVVDHIIDELAKRTVETQGDW